MHLLRTYMGVFPVLQYSVRTKIMIDTQARTLLVEHSIPTLESLTCQVDLAHIIDPGHSSQVLETNHRTEYHKLLPLRSM
jgi:hypothetical protein